MEGYHVLILKPRFSYERWGFRFRGIYNPMRGVDMTPSNDATAIFKAMMEDYISLGYCAFALVNESGDVLIRSLGWRVFEKTFKKHFINNHLPKLLKLTNKKRGDLFYETKVDNFIVKYKFIINWPSEQGSFAAFAIPQTTELRREITSREVLPIYFPFKD